MKAFSMVIAMVAMLCYSQNIAAQTNTEGMLTFQVTSVSDGVAYAPRHVLAIWIKDGSGNFVKSRKVMAATRKQHLVKWMASSANNSTDAITGATLTQHTSHAVSWDCRNLQGNVVVDGNYEIWIEYSSQNSASTGIAGPFYSFTFSKGSNPLNISIPDQSYFKSMTLTYTPSAVIISDAEQAGKVPVQIRSEGQESVISFELPETMPVHLAIYDLQGKRIHELCDHRLEAGFHSFRVNHVEVPKGIALVRLWTSIGYTTKKWSVSAH